MAKRMTRMAAAAVAATCLTPLILSSCATREDPDALLARDRAAADAPIAKGPTGIQRYRIRDWSAPNDHILIITTNDGTKFRAETFGPCPGLSFSSRVGFVNRGGFNRIDRTSSVVLADGTRCPFQSFDEIRTAEATALDSYEKAEEAKPKEGADAQSGDAKSTEDTDGKSDQTQPGENATARPDEPKLE